MEFQLFFFLLVGLQQSIIQIICIKNMSVEQFNNKIIGSTDEFLFSPQLQKKKEITDSIAPMSPHKLINLRNGIYLLNRKGSESLVGPTHCWNW